MDVPPFYKGRPQQLTPDPKLTIELEKELTLEEKVDTILAKLQEDKKKDLFVKIEDCIVAFVADVFKHLEGEPLRSCVETFVGRVLEINEREKTKPKRKFTQMTDNSPKISDYFGDR